LAHANQVRDWRIYADFAHVLIGQARILYAQEDFGVQLKQTVYAFDATTIDLCLSLFPWAQFRQRKGAIKLHILMDLRGSIPTLIFVTHGKVHEVNLLDDLPIEPGAVYIFDRGYLDFARLYKIHRAGAFFVIRAKSNFRFRRLYSQKADKAKGIQADQIIELHGFYARRDYPDRLRRIRYYDAEKEKRLIFLTNNFILPATTIAELFRCRWKIELFFKWVKQHLRIKAFYGTSENAVKTQIWIAISAYVLVAIIKKKLKVEASLYTMLQILSVSLFEKTPLFQLLLQIKPDEKEDDSSKQLKLL
jgi:transposase